VTLSVIIALHSSDHTYRLQSRSLEALAALGISVTDISTKMFDMAVYGPDGRTAKIRFWAESAGDSQYFPFVGVVYTGILNLQILNFFLLQPEARNVSQAEFEGLLREHLMQYGVKVEKSTELAELSQDETKVSTRINRGSGEEVIECAYVVAADGAKGTYFARFMSLGNQLFNSRAYTQIPRYTLSRRESI
jgi:2-polyprenyl-6-methoxyphenol hydroxylase-like FAD-dependent oxidoreductase